MSSRILILIFLIATLEEVNGQKFTNGYIVSLANDTQHVILKIPSDPNSTKGEIDLAQGVEIKESDSTRFISPSEIKSYGFKYKGRDYIRVSKSINNYRRFFLVPEFTGNKISLYSFTTTGVYSQHAGVIYNGGVAKMPGRMGIENTYYTFEKPDGKTLFASKYDSPRELREMLKEFFSDSPETQARIEKKVVGSSTAAATWNAIKKIVSDYNEESRDETR